MPNSVGRRRYLARSGVALAMMAGLAGCNTGSAPTTRTTSVPTTISASPENGKLKFINNTDEAVCSLELENVVSGKTIEILDLPNTHDKLKPHYKFTYASADYAQIDDDAIYDITATTCDGNKTAKTRDFNFGRGGVWRINRW